MKHCFCFVLCFADEQVNTVELEDSAVKRNCSLERQ